MLLDAGRVPNVLPGPWCQINNGITPNPYEEVGAAIIERQRYAAGFTGFKSTASTLLLGADENGMPPAEAAAYLTSGLFRQHLSNSVLASIGAFRRCVIRVEVWISTSKADGNDFADEVSVQGNTYIVPYIIKCPRHTVATVAQLVNALTTIITGVRLFIDQLPAQDGSSRLLERLIGAHVWATPSNAAVPFTGPAGAGFIQRPGIIDSRSRDGRCFIRSVLMGLDPLLHARTKSSLCQLVNAAREGVQADLKRMELLPPDKCDEAVQRTSAVLDALSKLTPASFYGGVSLMETPADMERSKFSSRAGKIEEALALATAGTHPLVDFSDPIFASPFEVSVESIEFIRSKLPSNVKLQVWGEDVTGAGAALDYAAEKADWSFLTSGGALINILCADGHAALLTSIGAFNAALTKTNRRMLCPLCGLGLPHVSSGHPIGSTTRLIEHVLSGCALVASGDVPVVVRTSGDSGIRRILPMKDVGARFRAPLFALLSEDAAGAELTTLTSTGAYFWDLFDPFSESDIQEWQATIREFGLLSVASEREYSNDTAVLDLRWRVSSRRPSTAASRTGPVYDLLSRLLETDAIYALFTQLHVVWPRESRSEDVHETACVLCRQPLSAESVWSHRLWEETDSDAGEAVEFVPDTSSSLVLLGCPVSGKAHRVHARCKSVYSTFAGRRSELVIHVTTPALLASIAAVVCQEEFVDSVLSGNLPSLVKSRDGIRGVVVRIGRRGHTGFRSVRFRCAPPTTPDAQGCIETSLGERTARSLLRWADGELSHTRLWPLAFETDIAYSRAALLDSQPIGRPPVSVLVDAQAIAQFARMPKGGRVLVGDAVYHPPISADRSTVRLNFDFTAMYPAVVKEWPLPSEEHTDALIANFEGRLEEGVAFLRTYPVYDPMSLVARVELSGSFPEELHARLSQFPPLFSRMPVPASFYSDFQRARMGIRIDSPPQMRSVCHLLPLTKAVMFLREAQLLLRLGFVCSWIGDVRGCNGSFWAREFMLCAEVRRRSAQASGDAAQAAASKRIVNSVIGAMNMNTGAYTSLRAVRSSAIDIGTLEAVGGADVDVAKRGRGGTGPPKRAYTRRMADDPSFTGRVYTCGAGTYVEFAAKATKHSQSTAFSLAVQAYARCRHAELWYGSPGEPGILSAFPAARVLYGNTDSLMVEISLSDADVAAGWTDARAKLLYECAAWFDLSTVPASSSLWDAVGPHGWTSRSLQPEVTSRAGRWGLVKEISGWAGYETVVVNGPNRCGMRVLQCSDTLPEHRTARDTLKSLRVTAAVTATFEEYAEDWLREGGGRGAVCRWGNGACIVTSDGKHLPFGCKA